MTRTWPSLTVVLLLAGVAVYALRRESPPRFAHTAALDPSGSEPQPDPVTLAVAAEPPPATLLPAPAPLPERDIPLDEPALMAKMRELELSDPSRSLALARAGDARFPDSPDAAERGWFVVRSLVDLKRFQEARDEARTMVTRYRGTSWAEDVERHTLVYPIDQPSREEQQQLEQNERDLDRDQ